MLPDTSIAVITKNTKRTSGLLNAPMVIGICGASGSGKTYLSTRLVEALGSYEPVHIQVDSYYQDLSHLDMDTRSNYNYDLPEAIDYRLLAEHIYELKNGRKIPKIQYCFESHTRKPSFAEIFPGSIIVLEGIFAFHWKQLRELIDYKIMVDTDLQLCFSRRFIRDKLERGRTEASIIKQYKNTVEPSIGKYILPQKVYADLLVNGARDITEILAEIRGSCNAHEKAFKIANSITNYTIN